MNRRDFVSGAAMGITAMAVVSTGGVAEAQPSATSLNVVYPNHEGAKFDTAYYRSTHIPLVTKVMKATKATLIEGVPMGSAAPPFAMIAHIEFASAEALSAGLANPAMADVRADVAKFTDIKPTVMLGRTL
jgi:uncharacterized protein (TIGR02118 family)